MADISFTCTRCTQRLVIDDAGVGITVRCPTCTHLLTVPGMNRDQDLQRTQKLLPFHQNAESSVRGHPKAA
jgi:DNA-directed RNA polymerase subunit RPC12/RpoP